MIVKCPNRIPDWNWINDKLVFLMGPIQGAPKWQFSLPEIDGATYLSPRREKFPLLDFNYDKQVDWESNGIKMADVILVWIPKEVEHIDGRDYAQTTRFEVGESLGRGKQMIIGIHDEFPGRKYFEYKAKKYNNIINNTIYSSLDECIDVLKDIIKHGL